MNSMAPTDMFQHAARYEADLTERQREVLCLIASGRTNGEIAEALAITLAGAKWHVSELLTKLGLDSREAAAEYYRWRGAPRRRVGRSLRGLFSAPVLKLGAATAAGIGAVAVAAGVILAMNGGDEIHHGPAVPGLPFYMEAESVSTRPDRPAPSADSRRYWFQDATHVRVEQGSLVGGVIVRDGLKRWQAAGNDLYRGVPLDQVTSKTQALDGTRLGPIPDASISEFVKRLRNDGAATLLAPGISSVEVRRIRSDRLLGIDVDGIEVVTLDASGARIGWRRFWIDPVRLFVLKYEAEISQGWNETETVTKLVYGAAQPAERFVWVPAAGTTEITCQESLANQSQGIAPAPFLRIPLAAVPHTLQPRTFGTILLPDGTCDVWRYEFATALDSAVPAVLYIRQEAHNLDSVFSSAPSEKVDIIGVEARLGDADDGGRSVAWATTDVGVEIRSTVLTDEELIAFAQSMVEANR